LEKTKASSVRTGKGEGFNAGAPPRRAQPEVDSPHFKWIHPLFSHSLSSLFFPLSLSSGTSEKGMSEKGMNGEKEERGRKEESPPAGDPISGRCPPFSQSANQPSNALDAKHRGALMSALHTHNKGRRGFPLSFLF
jgi:hypothetical protein